MTKIEHKANLKLYAEQEKIDSNVEFWADLKKTAAEHYGNDAFFEALDKAKTPEEIRRVVEEFEK